MARENVITEAHLRLVEVQAAMVGQQGYVDGTSLASMLEAADSGIELFRASSEQDPPPEPDREDALFYRPNFTPAGALKNGQRFLRVHVPHRGAGSVVVETGFEVLQPHLPLEAGSYTMLYMTGDGWKETALYAKMLRGEDGSAEMLFRRDKASSKVKRPVPAGWTGRLYLRCTVNPESTTISGRFELDDGTNWNEVVELPEVDPVDLTDDPHLELQVGHDKPATPGDAPWPANAVRFTDITVL